MMKACCEKAIPVVEEPLRYERADFVASELIEITDCKKLAVQMQYPLLGMRHAESRCLVRKEVYEKLIVAAGLLPKGYRLCIWDAWRPFALQQELLEQYTGDIIREFRLEEATEEERKAVISQFVAEPVEDRLVPPVHTTGGAVDVTILDTYGQPLNMGTDFDAFTDKTHTAFFEGRQETEIRDNRRLLYHAMVGAGFTSLPSEWWHYDYGDRIWAYYTGKPAIYKGIFTWEENV